jgi:DNA (cytosine-5)-methyltransferase 1
MKLDTVSFFTGSMGLDLGLEEAGFKPIFACEIDPRCRETIAANRPNLPVAKDIMSLDAKEVREISEVGMGWISLVCGGPPCQSYSTAGKRRGFGDKRGNAMVKFLELSTSLNPDYILIENVRGMLSCKLDGKAGGVFRFILVYLRSKGYNASYRLYNSADFGVPQKRERVILIATRLPIAVPLLVPTHSDRELSGLPPWVTFREAVKGLPDSPKDFFGFSERATKFFRKIKAGENWKSLPIGDQRDAMKQAYYSGGGKTGFFRRLAWDKPAPTLVTSPCMKATSLAHPEEDRYLSVQEYKRLQCFPDDWKMSGSTDDKYRQLGNAVPTLLGKAAGLAIRRHLG